MTLRSVKETRNLHKSANQITSVVGSLSSLSFGGKLKKFRQQCLLLISRQVKKGREGNREHSFKCEVSPLSVSHLEDVCPVDHDPLPGQVCNPWGLFRNKVQRFVYDFIHLESIW